jgi:Ca2+-binding RTX toxin-like protein
MRDSGRRGGSGSARTRLGALIAALTVIAALPGAVAYASDWVKGDVFAGSAGNPATYEIFDNNGVFKESISKAGVNGNSTGCGFNAGEDLWGTFFQGDQAVRFANAHPHGDVQTINLPPGNHPESITFAANGDFYIGNADGDRDIYKFDAAGNPLGQFDVAVGPRGSDHIDLAADQSTIFYTSEGRTIFRYDTAANAQLADFATLPGGGASFGIRILPPGDGSGGVLVADSGDVKRLDGSGNVVQTYDAPGEDVWFALNLDPNGTSFWSADLNTRNVYRFNIASGAVEVGPLTNPGQVGGLCVLGELTAGVPPTPETQPPTPGVDVDCEGRTININGRTFQGDDTNETIQGTPDRDLLRGGGGDDAIDGLPGDDCINGQAGNDAMLGADGADTVRGEAGSDAADGAAGNDDIDGGTDADELEGGADNDRVIGRGSEDRVKGDSGNDRTQGSGGNDRVNGDGGKDTSRGGTGDDRVTGGPGKDKVQSQGGEDRISGGDGKDNIRAGGGNDEVDSADGFPDQVKCGLGFDEAVVDDKDTVNDDCNEVTVKQGDR